MLIRNFTSVFMLFDGVFVTSKITKICVFATKPRMWFWPLILWFRGNRNDYGVWTEKIVYFSILRLFHAFLMQWFWCFLYGFCSIFSGYGVFRLFSGCNFFVLFTFTVNNFILYANSTEISGFSVLLCFLRPSILPCWYYRHFTDERRLWLFQVIVSGGYENRTICTLKQRPWLCFRWKTQSQSKLGRVQSKRNWWTPAARMSARHDKYLLSFTNLLLQLLVANNISNANGLKVILHEKVQYNRLSRRSIGFSQISPMRHWLFYGNDCSLSRIFSSYRCRVVRKLIYFPTNSPI